jgi:hypothetical protein
MAPRRSAPRSGSIAPRSLAAGSTLGIDRATVPRGRLHPRDRSPKGSPGAGSTLGTTRPKRVARGRLQPRGPLVGWVARGRLTLGTARPKGPRGRLHPRDRSSDGSHAVGSILGERSPKGSVAVGSRSAPLAQRVARGRLTPGEQSRAGPERSAPPSGLVAPRGSLGVGPLLGTARPEGRSRSALARDRSPKGSLAVGSTLSTPHPSPLRRAPVTHSVQWERSGCKGETSLPSASRSCVVGLVPVKTRRIPQP